MFVDDLIQRSPEWLEMRKGMCTGSMVADAVAKMKTQPKNGPTAYQKCRENYMMDLVATRLTGLMPERYVSRAMEVGIEREGLAIAAYEMRQNVMVEPVGFAFHPTIEWYGSSPDGLVGSDIVLEAKCPTAATHLRYIMEYQEARDAGVPYAPEEYLPQIKAEIACTERVACHFISFNSDFPENLQLLVSEWPRDREMIEAQEAEVVKFLAETAELLDRLNEMNLDW